MIESANFALFCSTNSYESAHVADGQAISAYQYVGVPYIHDKRGSIPVDLAPILLRLGIEPENWLESVSQFESRYRRVMGPIKALRELAEATGIRWFHDISRCLQFYRPSPA